MLLPVMDSSPPSLANTQEPPDLAVCPTRGWVPGGTTHSPGQLTLLLAWAPAGAWAVGGAKPWERHTCGLGTTAGASAWPGGAGGREKIMHEACRKGEQGKGGRTRRSGQRNTRHDRRCSINA